MSFKLHIFTHDQDNVQIPSIVSIIVYNMYLEASEMCVWGVTTSLRRLWLHHTVISTHTDKVDEHNDNS